MNKHFLIALIASVLLGSCGIPEPVKDIPIFQTVEEPKLEFTQAGGAASLRLASELAWTLSPLDEGLKTWLSVSPESGSASEQLQPITFTVSANQGSERSATIILLAGERKFFITITQAKKEEGGSQGGSSGSSEGEGGSGGEGGGSDEGGSGSGGEGSGTGGEGGGSAETNWLELPDTSTPGMQFIAHDASLNGRKVRNWSCFYDKEAMLSHWVAYPMYDAICTKKVGRTDKWAPDPKVSTSDQPILKKGYSGGSYSRGHQIASGDRLATTEMNNSTFYYTNMTPQIQDFNGAIWNSLEMAVRDWSSQMDTLYVVTGCDIKGSTKYATDNSGEKCVVPVGYYKALVGYKSSGFGSAGKYVGIAFYFNHKKYPDTKYMNSKMSMVVFHPVCLD